MSQHQLPRSYNLLTEPWIPVRAQEGIDWIAPSQITRSANPPLSLASPRPDFNGALAQFLIALLQTAFAPRDEAEWRKRWTEPPDTAELARHFLAMEDAFELLGDGPRFLQELDFPSRNEQRPIETLLIDAPGENTLKNNADHFVRRGRVQCLGLPEAATALLTLQLNAPSGGQGHRTSLRGGGPLTTLLLGDTLWSTLWLNILPADKLEELGGNPNKQRFAWLEPTHLSKKGETLFPQDCHPLVCFWAMPRRVRLGPVYQGTCSMSGRSGPVVCDFETLSHGNNYGDGFRHPLTPYSKPSKAEFALSLKGKPIGLPYTEWPSLVSHVGDRSPATIVEYAIISRRLRYLVHQGKGPRLWVFGFDMDNMKARSWNEVTTPLHFPDSEKSDLRKLQEAFGLVVGRWVTAAEDIRKLVAHSAEVALCHKNRERLKPDYWTGLHSEFWRTTETTFYELVRNLAEDPTNPVRSLELTRQWREHLGRAARTVFAQYAPLGPAPDPEQLKRFVQAERLLTTTLHGPKLAKTLGLPQKSKKTSQSKKASEGSRQTAKRSKSNTTTHT